MNKLIAWAFCLLLGAMIAAQGWTAVLWVPVGFVLGLFVSSNVILLLMLGLPRAIRLVVRGQMRPAVFGAIIRTPVIWFVQIFAVAFLIGWFWPTTAEYLVNNPGLISGMWLGTIGIILSPLSKKTRSDFRADFDIAYRRFYTEEAQSETEERQTVFTPIMLEPTEQKQVRAAITVMSNLYLNTIPEAEEAPALLQFGLPDSRFRYLIFCLSAVVSAVLAYDERKEIKLDVLVKGCLHFMALTATENAQEFFGGPASLEDAVNSANSYLTEFSKRWSIWPDLEKEGRSVEITELICSMIHTTESNEPTGESDMQRLGELALQINCRLPTMRRAFVELACGKADD